MSEFCISNKDWNKIINYARAREQECGDEIGGMAIAKQDKEGDWIISEPTILKQETTGGTCTLDKDDLAQFYADKAAKHGTNIQFVWWHSHAKMAAFWSGTDTDTMTEYKSGDWSMFLVVNVRGEYKFRVQYWNPFEMGEDIELTILNSTSEYKVPKNIIKEVESKCSKPTIGITKYSSYNRGRQSTLPFYNYKPGLVTNEIDDYLDEFEAIMEGNQIVYGNELTIESDPISFLMWQLDEGNNQFCDGSLKYDKYVRTLTQFNQTLEKLRTANGPEVKVVIYPKKALMDFIMTSNPHDFITIDDKPIANLYEQKKIEEEADLNSWNQSFGLGGYNV